MQMVLLLVLPCASAVNRHCFCACCISNDKRREHLKRCSRLIGYSFFILPAYCCAFHSANTRCPSASGDRMGGVEAVQGNLPQHMFSPRRRTIAGIRNASWALFVLKTAGNRKTEVSNETSVFMVEISGIEPLTS